MSPEVQALILTSLLSSIDLCVPRSFSRVERGIKFLTAISLQGVCWMFSGWPGSFRDFRVPKIKKDCTG